MNLLSFIGDIFKPAAKLIDAVHTSTEEKMKLNAAIKTIENELLVKVIDYETKLIEAKASIIT